jgi:hypothetical protein
MDRLVLEWMLQFLFVACCPAPFIVPAIRRCSAIQITAWSLASVAACMVSFQANPLEAGLHHVDGTMFRMNCTSEAAPATLAGGIMAEPVQVIQGLTRPWATSAAPAVSSR